MYWYDLCSLPVTIDRRDDGRPMPCSLVDSNEERCSIVLLISFTCCDSGPLVVKSCHCNVKHTDGTAIVNRPGARKRFGSCEQISHDWYIIVTPAQFVENAYKGDATSHESTTLMHDI
jgi:hypothetical protein